MINAIGINSKIFKATVEKKEMVYLAAKMILETCLGEFRHPLGP